MLVRVRHPPRGVARLSPGRAVGNADRSMSGASHISRRWRPPRPPRRRSARRCGRAAHRHGAAHLLLGGHEAVQHSSFTGSGTAPGSGRRPRRLVLEAAGAGQPGLLDPVEQQAEVPPRSRRGARDEGGAHHQLRAGAGAPADAGSAPGAPAGAWLSARQANAERGCRGRAGPCRRPSAAARRPRAGRDGCSAPHPYAQRAQRLAQIGGAASRALPGALGVPDVEAEHGSSWPITAAP